MRQSHTISIFAERRGKILEFSVTWLEMASGVVLCVALLAATAWLAFSGVPTAQARHAGLSDPAVSRGQEASLAEATRAAAASTHRVEDLLAAVSTALGSPIPDAERLFHEIPGEALGSLRPDSPTQELEEMPVLLSEGSETLEAVAELNDLLQDRLLAHIPNAWPLGGGKGSISFEFGPAVHPISRSWYLHKGVDVAAPPGVPVLAMANGTVTDIRRDSNNYGLQVVVSHPQGFRTSFAHLSRADVAVGDTVVRGQRIGAVGVSGLTTGPTLHLELFLGEEVLDPIQFLAMNNDSLQQRRRGS